MEGRFVLLHDLGQWGSFDRNDAFPFVVRNPRTWPQFPHHVGGIYDTTTLQYAHYHADAVREKTFVESAFKVMGR
jgi:hypothetical protein